MAFQLGTCSRRSSQYEAKSPDPSSDRYVGPIISRSCCSLQKSDAEGMELAIMRGGEKLLRKCHPHLLLEVSDLANR